MDKLQIRLLALIALALAGPVGCGDDDSSDDDQDNKEDSGPAKDGGGNAGKGGAGAGGSGNAGTSGGRDSGMDASTTDGGVDGGADGGPDAGPPPAECPAIGDREVVEVPEEISEDTVWDCDHLYILQDLTFIVDDKTLTVEAGTVVQGNLGSALIATRGSQLITEGTVTDPVVFTSSGDEGLRVTGDWGGVALLGAAPINIPGGENRIEGVDPADPRGPYGGDDETHDCGSLEYTRIEFAGFALAVDNELNGLTMGGCGSDTTVSYLQVHKGNDDGVEIFGGEPKLDHIVLTANEDDGFDTDLGYVGTVQFMVVQQDPDSVNSNDPNGFEWDSNPANFDATPRNAPTIYNATLIGAQDGLQQRGLILRRGTHGILRNLIVMGFPIAALDVRDMATANGAAEDPPTLTIDNSLFFDNGADGMIWWPEESATATPSTDNDMGFVEADFFTAAARENVFGEDPELADPFNFTEPNFVPASDSPAADGAATPPAGFDTSATYKGAFEPGGDDWTEGWTAYPQD